MEKLDLKLQQFKQALAKLIDAKNQPKTEFIRDSVIKRFEFCFDLSWKLIKTCLEVKNGVVCVSPKNCFREAYANSILSNETDWLALTELRNQLAHIYREQVADEAYDQMDAIILNFQSLVAKIEQ
jgi:nucleotidyltransferase substrate binding protein (TIGR01987 family)